MKRLVAVLCSLALLAGCIGTSPVGGLPEAPKNPSPYTSSSSHAHAAYKLQVGDTMDIKLRFNPELNDQIIVRPDGMVSTSIADDVPAAGYSVKELKKELEVEYRSELKRPHIAVILRSFAPNRIYVLGEVTTPGEFTAIGRNFTLLQAIAKAGGLKNSARPGNIIIVRNGEDGTQKAYAADYSAAASGEDPASNVLLEPYDVVFVPRSGIGNVYLYFQQYVQEFLPISFGANYEVNQKSNVGTVPVVSR